MGIIMNTTPIPSGRMPAPTEREVRLGNNIKAMHYEGVSRRLDKLAERSTVNRGITREMPTDKYLYYYADDHDGVCRLTYATDAEVCDYADDSGSGFYEALTRALTPEEFGSLLHDLLENVEGFDGETVEECGVLDDIRLFIRDSEYA